MEGGGCRSKSQQYRGKTQQVTSVVKYQADCDVKTPSEGLRQPKDEDISVKHNSNSNSNCIWNEESCGGYVEVNVSSGTFKSLFVTYSDTKTCLTASKVNSKG